MSNDYGNFSINGSLQKISVDEVIRVIRQEFESTLLHEPVYIGDTPVNLTAVRVGQGGFRYFFVCPRCSLQASKLYWQDSIFACRQCVRLKYPSSRFKGMIESQVSESS